MQRHSSATHFRVSRLLGRGFLLLLVILVVIILLLVLSTLQFGRMRGGSGESDADTVIGCRHWE